VQRRHRGFVALCAGRDKIAGRRGPSRDFCEAGTEKLMKKREAIKEAIEAWATSSNPETVGRLGSNDAEAEELRSDLSKKIIGSIKARKKKSKSN
jgi:hypothetical protein